MVPFEKTRVISYISIFKQTYAVSEILASRGKSASKHSASKGRGLCPITLWPGALPMHRTCLVEELAKPCNRFVQSFQFHLGCELITVIYKCASQGEAKKSKQSGRTSVGLFAGCIVPGLCVLTAMSWPFIRCCKAVSFMGLCPLTSDCLWTPLGAPPQTHYKLALRARHAPYMLRPP